MGHVWKMFENMFKNTFKSCSRIELNTTNPNRIFEITKYYTPPQCQNTFNVFEQTENIKSFKTLFCYLYKLHNSYFVFFFFGNVVIMGFYNFVDFILHV